MNTVDLDKINLSTEAPVQEPERQYYFMAKLRALVNEKSKKLGRPLVASAQTFGCQMNARDSEKITGILEAVGYEITEN